MDNKTQSESEHVLALSGELLDDIELSRLDTDKLLLKCSRLARLAGSEKIQEWIIFEMQGYNSASPIALKYMTWTGRWIDIEKKRGYWGPLAQQEASIAAMRAKIASFKLPDVSGDKAFITTKSVMDAITATTNSITTLSRVKSQVLALLHNGFVSEVYYERFASFAESTFERYKREVDGLIVNHCAPVLTKNTGSGGNS
jgi:hypothetical protein